MISTMGIDIIAESFVSRGVLRSVHPILIIRARASGGPGKGPLHIVKFISKYYKKRRGGWRPV